MYLSLLVKNFKQQFAYRSDVFFRIIGSILRIYIQICIWTALLGHGGFTKTVSLPAMISYAIVSYFISELIHSRISYTIANKVRLGAIAIDLIRPVSLVRYLFCEQLSENVFYLIFAGGPVLLVAICFWGFTLPALPVLAHFLISLALAVILMFYIEMAAGLLVFWVKDGAYADMLVGGLFTVFSGSTIPLWFYPKFLVTVANALPFRYITFEPISVFLGKYDLDQARQVILIQMFWIGVVWLLERTIWQRVQKSIFVQGG